MTRLQSELHRLYLSPSPATSDAPSPDLVDPPDTVRAMVVELTRPPSWEILSRIWQGVQTELGLPAPAIAVSGTDGLQLWFSVEAPIAVAQAHAFVEGLRARFLPDIESGRVRLVPSPQERRARQVPALQEQTGNWSAFVARDLAPVFEETPWLDIPPGEEGQAALLRNLEVMERPAFEAALDKLGSRTDPSPPPGAAATNADPTRTTAQAAGVEADDDPRRFLLRVMNDASVPLALRVDAAKALLQSPNGTRPLPPGA